MGAPTKDGIDYFSFDVGFFRDKKVKLIKAEFGAKGLMILLFTLCQIYESNGYYMQWDKDDCLLMADAVGCGVTPELVSQVMNSCVKRSIFDEELFNVAGILTSRGIQRRFVRAASQRDEIQIVEKYFLLNVNNKKDVPKSVSIKITFLQEKTNGNPDETNDNSKKTYDNPKSKVKESKVKKINNKPGTECSEQVVFRMPLKDNTEFDITESQYTEFVQAYPEVDINQELKKMRVWCNSNPTKKKTKRGVMRFINSWLDRVTKPPQYPQTGTGEKYDYSTGGDTF
jgi:hypothetical protein